MKKMLPVAVPVIGARYNYAVPLTIMGITDAYLPWLFSHYINLHFLRSSDYESFNFAEAEFPIRYEGVFAHFLKYTEADRSSADGCIADYLMKLIDDGFYVYATFNKFYIPGTFYYRRTYFHHPLLVYGYCTDRREFYIKTFNEHFVYSDSKASFEQMADAFAYVDEPSLSDSYRTIRQFQWLPDRTYAINIPQIVRSMDQFVNPPLSGSTSVTGHNVYPIIQWHIEQLLADKTEGLARRRKLFSTRKNLQVILEHNQLMLMRIHYLIEHGHLPGKDYEQRQKALVNAVEILRSLFVKYWIRPNDSHLTGIVRALDSFAVDQVDLMARIRDDLTLGAGTASIGSPGADAAGAGSASVSSSSADSPGAGSLP